MRIAVFVLVVALFLTIAWMTWQWFHARAQAQALRDNPPPKVALLVKLPKEAEKSNAKMTRFYGRLERLMNHDPDAIASNQNVISAALVGTGAGVSQAPVVRFLIWSPPDMVDRIQMELQECYEGQAQVTEIPVEQDPLALWASQHQQFLRWEQEHNQLAKNPEPPEAE